MPSGNEIARIASAINLLRPDWPTASLQTFISSKHASRPMHDLAVALTYVATDPTTTTPARIDKPGPWWLATASNRPAPDVTPMCRTCNGLHGPDEPHAFGVRPDAEVATRGAALCREAMRLAREEGAREAERVAVARQSAPVGPPPPPHIEDDDPYGDW